MNQVMLLPYSVLKSKKNVIIYQHIYDPFYIFRMKGQFDLAF